MAPRNAMALTTMILCLITLLRLDGTSALSVDPSASTDLEQLIKSDFVISIRHIRPRRKLQIPLEALFMIDFPTAKHKLSFFIDRKDKRMTMDINSGQKLYSKHFHIESLNETTTIRSMALLFRQENATLFIDCKKVATLNLEMSMTQMYLSMEEPVLKIFRERKYPLHFDSSVADALWRANCHKQSGRRENRRYLKGGLKNRSSAQKHYFKVDGENLISDQSSDKNRKRHIRNWQQEESARHKEEQRRGDIQVVSGDCDDAMSRSLSELVSLVKQLTNEVSSQRNEISFLRQLIENCAGCQPDHRREQLRASCHTNNPCYPGVQCYDTTLGTRCGHCPRGYIGDGKNCTPGQSCADSPCYSGVQCYDTVEGGQCGPCPGGYDGDGKTCVLRQEVQCKDKICSGESQGYVIKRKHEQHIRTKVITTS